MRRLIIAALALGLLLAAPAGAHHMEMTPEQIMSRADLPPKLDRVPAGERRAFRQAMRRADRGGARAAHRIPWADAKSRWYYVFKAQCGNGWGWWCILPNYHWDGEAAPYPMVHGWYVRWTFTEGKVTALAKQRFCTIRGRLSHTSVEWWAQDCGPEVWR